MDHYVKYDSISQADAVWMWKALIHCIAILTFITRGPKHGTLYCFVSSKSATLIHILNDNQITISNFSY